MAHPLITSGAPSSSLEETASASWNPQSDGIGLIHSLMGEIVHILREEGQSLLIQPDGGDLSLAFKTLIV